jgi:hypothetical protein
MSGLAGRLRRVLGRRRPGTTLVRVGPPEPLPPPPARLALPAPPRPKEPPRPRYPVCPWCGQRHASLPRFPAGRATVITARAGRPEVTGAGDDKALVRDRVSPWREG